MGEFCPSCGSSARYKSAGNRCVPCHKQDVRTYQLRNPGVLRAAYKRYRATQKGRDSQFFCSASTNLRRRKGVDGGPTAAQLRQLFQEQRGRCTYFGVTLDIYARDRSVQIDHKIPISRGGTNEISNLQWVCREANIMKMNRTDAEFRVRLRELGIEVLTTGDTGV